MKEISNEGKAVGEVAYLELCSAGAFVVSLTFLARLVDFTQSYECK